MAMLPSDEEVAAQLLAFFLAAPSKHADGVLLYGLARTLGVGMGALTAAVRSAPTDFVLVNKRTRARSRRSKAHVVCLNPVFNSQLPSTGGPGPAAGGSHVDGPLECRLCDVSFSNEDNKLAHLRSSRHQAAVLLQQLRASGSISANQAGLEVSELPDGVSLEENREHKLSLVVTNVGTQTHTLQRVFQVRRLPEIETPDGTLIIAPGQQVTVDIYVTPRYYGVLRTLVVLDFGGVLIARELRVGCSPEGFAGVNLGPSAPYTGPQRVRLAPQDAPFEAGVKPPKARTIWQKPPRQWKVPDRLRRLVSEGLAQEVQDELDKFRGKTDIASHLSKLHLLLHMEELQQELDVRMYDMQEATMLNSHAFLALEVPGLAESRPSVMKGDALYVRPAEAAEGSKEWQGYVHVVREKEVLLKFDGRFHSSIWLPSRRFRVRFAIKRTPFVFQHQALEVAAAGCVGGARSELLLPPAAAPLPCSNGLQVLAWKNRQLNEEQQAAVECVLQGSAGRLPFIIWGPPGTGKTSTLVEAAAQVLALMPRTRTDLGARLLLVAPSNTAADMLAERLLGAGVPKSQLLRVCAYARPEGDLPEVLRDVVLWDASLGAYQLPSLGVALSKRVLVATPIMAAKLYALGIPAGHFTHIMLDEAGHAEEPLSLCALSGLVGPDCSVTLAGDPKQLGPVVHSRLAATAGLGLSLLERLTQTLPYAAVAGLGGSSGSSSSDGSAPTHLIVKLLANYRNHPRLLSLPSQLFYAGELRACAHPDHTHNLLHWPELGGAELPLLFHSVVGAEEREGSSPSWFNIWECKVVAMYVQSLRELRRSPVSGLQIGVISPYRKQVQKLQKVLDRCGPSGVQVGTVEQFQGSERRVIIISTVRSTPSLIEHDMKHKLGFLANPKRFNVATTRAKALMIIVGNPEVLRRDPCWRQLLRLAQAHGRCEGSPMPDLSEPATAAAGVGSNRNGSSSAADASASRLEQELAHLQQLMGSLLLSSLERSVATGAQQLVEISGLVAEGTGGMVRHD